MLSQKTGNYSHYLSKVCNLLESFHIFLLNGKLALKQCLFLIELSLPCLENATVNVQSLLWAGRIFIYENKGIFKMQILFSIMSEEIKVRNHHQGLLRN